MAPLYSLKMLVNLLLTTVLISLMINYADADYFFYTCMSAYDIFLLHFVGSSILTLVVKFVWCYN